jgi:uncharacterized protein YjbJ (UPF0337 family)
MLNTNEDVFAGQWKSLRKKAKQQWMSLTDDDIKRVDGNADVLADLLSERYGYSQDKAWDEIRLFSQMYATPDRART